MHSKELQQIFVRDELQILAQGLAGLTGHDQLTMTLLHCI